MFYKSNETVFSLTVEGSEPSINKNQSPLTQPIKNSSPFTKLKQTNKSQASLNSQSKNAIDTLRVISFQGVEGISCPYAFQIELASEHIRFDITQLLSKQAFLAFTPAGTTQSGIHGVVQSTKRNAIDQHYAYFSIIITPRFTHLMKRVNQRKFVGKTVPDIISTILHEHGLIKGTESGFEFKFKDPAAYPTRDFCVQYDESDYSFVSRLAEEEGIAYHFQHTTNAHKMIFTDAPSFFPSLQNPVQLVNDTGLNTDTQIIKYFDISLASKTQTAIWRDFNFKTAKIPEGASNGKQSEKANGAIEPDLTYYDYPSTAMDKARNQQLANIEIERLRVNHLTAEGYSDIPTLHSGYSINIDNHQALDSMTADKPWLITQIKHQGFQPQVLEAFADSNNIQTPQAASQLQPYLDIDTDLTFPNTEQLQGYFNIFNAIPQQVPFRPANRHPRPTLLGSQTAIVVGPEGEEIYCDEYGRIKVQFHWDREGTLNENSSHWIRTATNWAHNGYGAVLTPRVGMEVVIQFLEGDPDNPIVVGALHNGINKTPYELPTHKTRSIFKTSSSKGGIGSNEFRIEDKAGEEQIFVQAQRNFDALTKHNHIIQINNNSHLQVNNQHSQTITGNRYTNNQAEEHRLTQLDRKTQIMGNDYKTVALSEHESIGTIKTTQAGMEIHLKSGLQTVIDGGLSLTLKAGGQHIVLNPAGIWMTMPVWTGGVPMEGMPATPIPPMTKQYGVPSTHSPQVTTLIAPSATKTNQLLAAQAQDNPPEIIKKLKFIIRPMANLPGYSDEPYKLYADGVLLQNGLTDQEGALYFDYIPSVKQYQVELINGHRYTIDLKDQLHNLTESDRLATEGYNSFDHSQNHQAKLTDITDYRIKANNPQKKLTPSTSEEDNNG